VKSLKDILTQIVSEAPLGVDPFATQDDQYRFRLEALNDLNDYISAALNLVYADRKLAGNDNKGYQKEMQPVIAGLESAQQSLAPLLSAEQGFRQRTYQNVDPHDPRSATPQQRDPMVDDPTAPDPMGGYWAKKR
jgi:hypothetical protein